MQSSFNVEKFQRNGMRKRPRKPNDYTNKERRDMRAWKREGSQL